MKIPFGYRACGLQQPVRERRFTVIYMGNDTKISYVSAQISSFGVNANMIGQTDDSKRRKTIGFQTERTPTDK